MPKDQKAEIHSYGHDTPSFDEDGELLYGFYWRMMDDFENPTTGLMGPYNNFNECRAALERAYKRHDY